MIRSTEGSTSERSDMMAWASRSASPSSFGEPADFQLAAGWLEVGLLEARFLGALMFILLG
jgi:hypothetical protein